MSRLETILDRLALGSFFSAVAILSALQVVSATEGCTALRAEAPVITADAAQVAGCIAKQAISGNASALSIGLACGIPAGVDTFAIVQALLAGMGSPAADSGIAGATAGPPSALVDALRRVHR